MKGQFLSLTDPPEAYLAYADAYLSAANILVGRRLELNDIFEIGPLYHLTAQCTELLFKALLLKNGVSAKSVKAYGHDIWELREAVGEFHDIRSILGSTNIDCAHSYYLTHKDEFEGLSLQEATDLLFFDWQLLALRENFYMYFEEKKPTFRTRYPVQSLSYKPVKLSIILPCLDKLLEFATSEILSSKDKGSNY